MSTEGVTSHVLYSPVQECIDDIPQTVVLNPGTFSCCHCSDQGVSDAGLGDDAAGLHVNNPERVQQVRKSEEVKSLELSLEGNK